MSPDENVTELSPRFRHFEGNETSEQRIRHLPRAIVDKRVNAVVPLFAVQRTLAVYGLEKSIQTGKQSASDRSRRSDIIVPDKNNTLTRD